jgi:hypothetical protein
LDEAETMLGAPIAFVFIRVHLWLKNKKPTAVSAVGLSNSGERIKTRLPRWSAARSQAASLSFDSRGETNAVCLRGQTFFSARMMARLPLQAVLA